MCGPHLCSCLLSTQTLTSVVWSSSCVLKFFILLDCNTVKSHWCGILQIYLVLPQYLPNEDACCLSIKDMSKQNVNLTGEWLDSLFCMLISTLILRKQQEIVQIMFYKLCTIHYNFQ